MGKWKMVAMKILRSVIGLDDFPIPIFHFLEVC
jgi:hypothetical protein